MGKAKAAEMMVNFAWATPEMAGVIQTALDLYLKSDTSVSCGLQGDIFLSGKGLRRVPMIELGKQNDMRITLSGTAKNVSLPMDMFLVGKDVWQKALKEAFEDVNKDQEKTAREDKAANAVIALKQQMGKMEKGFVFSGKLNSGVRRARIRGPLKPILLHNKFIQVNQPTRVSHIWDGFSTYMLGEDVNLGF